MSRFPTSGFLTPQVFPDTTKPQFSASRLLYGFIAYGKISNVSLSDTAGLPSVLPVNPVVRMS
jgi:hypothetical protein